MLIHLFRCCHFYFLKKCYNVVVKGLQDAEKGAERGMTSLDMWIGFLSQSNKEKQKMTCRKENDSLRKG